jgi:hypothetical protein
LLFQLRLRKSPWLSQEEELEGEESRGIDIGAFRCKDKYE